MLANLAIATHSECRGAQHAAATTSGAIACITHLCLSAAPSAVLTAIQIFAQPVYETVESRIKVWLIKRQLAAGAPPSAAPAKLDAGDATLAVTGGDVQLAVASGNATSEFKLSPFASTNARTTAALAAAESGDAISSGGNGLGPLPSGSAFGSGHVGLSITVSTELGHRAMSVRPSADGSHVANSCPIPTLMPPAGEALVWRC